MAEIPMTIIPLAMSPGAKLTSRQMQLLRKRGKVLGIRSNHCGWLFLPNGTRFHGWKALINEIQINTPLLLRKIEALRNHTTGIDFGKSLDFLMALIMTDAFDDYVNRRNELDMEATPGPRIEMT